MHTLVVMPLKGDLDSLKTGVKVWPLYARGEVSTSDLDDKLLPVSEQWGKLSAKTIWTGKPVHLIKDVVLTRWAEITNNGMSAVPNLSNFIELNNTQKRLRNRFVIGLFPDSVKQKDGSQVIGFVFNLHHLKKSRG